MRAHVTPLVADSLMDLPSVETDGRVAAKALRARLRQWEIKYAKAQSAATIKAVRSDWQSFMRWCERSNVRPLPITAENLVLFLQDMVIMGRRRATLNRYLHTIRLIHRAAGVADPARHDDWPLEWKAIVSQLAEVERNDSRQAEPLQSEGVAAILAQLGDSPHDLRDAALLSLASDTLCRQSELAKVQLKDITPTANPERAWALRLGRTKNDPQAKGSYRFVSPETKARIDRWCAAANITAGYLFLPIGGRRKTHLDGAPPPPAHLRSQEIAKIFRRRAQLVNPSARASGHSTRVGTAIDLIEKGYSSSAAAYAGGWKSERQVLEYAKQARVGTEAMADMRASQREQRNP